MNTIQDELRKAQQEIIVLKEQIEARAEVLGRLKQENTHRMEKVNWIKEQKSKLRRDRKHLRLKVEKQNGVISERRKPKTRTKRAIEITSFLIVQFIQKFLRNFTDSLDKQLQQKNSQDESYIVPYPIIRIKNQVRSKGDRTVSFRLDSLTTFAHLKKAAFDYWRIDQYLVDSSISYLDAFDMVELADETLSRPPPDETVIEFYRSKSIVNTSQITLNIMEIQNNKKQLNNLQIATIKINGGKNFSNLQNIKCQKARIKKVQLYKQVFQKFPGLRSYISEIRIEKEDLEQQKKHAENKVKQIVAEERIIIDDMSCLIIGIIIILLGLQYYTFSFYVNMQKCQQGIASIQKFMDISDESSYTAIYNSIGFYDWLEQRFATTIFNGESEVTDFRSYNEVVGSILVRQNRIQFFKCPRVVNQLQQNSCFHPFYDDIYKNTTSYRGFKYQTGEQLGISFAMKGNNSNFDDGGFTYELPRDFTIEQVRGAINDMKQRFFIDEYTQSLFIHFSSSSPSYNIWVQGNFILERNMHNQIIPYFPVLHGFNPNIFYKNRPLILLELVKLVLSICLLLYVGYFIRVQYQTKSLKRSIKYVIKEVGFFNLGASISTMLGVITSFKQYNLDLDLQKLLNNNQYQNLQTTGDYYLDMKGYNSLSIMFLLCRLVFLIKFEDFAQVLFTTFSYGAQQLIAFLTIQFPLCIGFTFAFQVLYGDRFEYFQTFTEALDSQIGIAQGGFEQSDFSAYQPYISSVAICTFYFYNIFFIISLFQAVLQESYRHILMRNGYRSNVQSDNKFAMIIQKLFQWTKLLKSKNQDSYEYLKTQEQQYTEGPEVEHL
ncbi:hypothetical protein pb186bvf_017199 [Paramecium bursaria]